MHTTYIFKITNPYAELQFSKTTIYFFVEVLKGYPIKQRPLLKR